jgi:hypothetical protein
MDAPPNRNDLRFTIAASCNKSQYGDDPSSQTPLHSAAYLLFRYPACRETMYIQATRKPEIVTVNDNALDC